MLRFYASTSHRPERGVVIVTPAIEPGLDLDAADPLLESLGLERQWFSGPGGACFERPRGATWVHLEPQGDVLRAFVWSRERSCGAEIVEGLSERSACDAWGAERRRHAERCSWILLLGLVRCKGVRCTGTS